MAIELILLGALIFIFIVSFCGLLQKIKQTYDRERIIAARIAQRREQRRHQRRSDDSFSEIYINPTFISDSNGGVFPAAGPPPYSPYFMEAPPKYEDVVKIHPSHITPPAENQASTENGEQRANEPTAENRPAIIPTAPPPYVINVSTDNNETSNHM